ncbi:hypothetical protein KKA14_13735 [bacterium]|nr:hypothetical protein [bacterium]
MKNIQRDQINKLSLLMVFFLIFIGFMSCQPIEEVENMDLETRAFVLTSDVSGDTSESAGTATFTVELAMAPSADVTITLSSSNLNEGTASPTSLIFTPSNWNVPQTVTMIGVDDLIFDGSTSYFAELHPTSNGDAVFNGVAVQPVAIVNLDNDTVLTALGNSNFSILRSGGACPTGFIGGAITLDTEDTDNTDQIDGTGDTIHNSPGIYMPICSTSSADVANVNAMKGSPFVLLRSNGSCPTGYSDGTIVMDSEDDHNTDLMTGNIGDSRTNGSVATLNTCHKDTDPNLDNLINKKFTFLKNGNCPRGSEAGTLRFDTEDSNNKDSYSGNIGDSRISTDFTFSIYLEMCTFIR